MFKGRFSILWRELQLQYMSRTENPEAPRPEYQTAEYWASHMIQQVVYFSLNSWQIRNDKLHEDKKQNAYNSRRRELKSKVRSWYMVSSTLGKRFDSLFKITCLARQQHSNQMMESWLATVQEKYDYHIRQPSEAEELEAARQRRRERDRDRRRHCGPPRAERRSGGGRGRGGGRGSRRQVILTGFSFSATLVRYNTR